MNDNTKRILGIHLGLLMAELICVSAFVIEFQRALSGNTLSWAYVFEWPIFAAYAVYLWYKLLHEERHPHESVVAPLSEAEDRSLFAYNEYLRRIHESAVENESDPQ